MTIIEKKSERKKKAIISLVKSGEMSVAYALSETERLNDEGKLLDNDYEELAEYLEQILEAEEYASNVSEDNVVEDNVEEKNVTEENIEQEYETENSEVNNVELLGGEG